MAFRRSLVHRLLNIPKMATSSSSKSRHLPPNPTFLQRLLVRPPASEEGIGLFRRFLHQNGSVFKSSSSIPTERLSIPIGDKLIEKLRELNGERIHIEALVPPMPPDREERGREITVEEVRKLLRVSQMEAVKNRLRGIKESCISYEKFLEICRGGDESSTLEHGLGIAKALDESGAVLVMGHIVLIKPELVARAIESVIPLPRDEASKRQEEELKALENKKAIIDGKAAAAVRRELWCGLGFLVVQTLGFMRLTFWDLSWDVMEPICFYVTSVYFMAGYTFFLRTSKDPSFEGFFESRFAARQKKLMGRENFDLARFQDLRRALGRRPSPLSTSFSPSQCLDFDSCSSSSSSGYCDCHRRDALLVH